MFLFGVFLIIYWLFRLWLSAYSGIHPDEAYYWTWSSDLSLGYHDHPPMIAWLISLSRQIVEWLPFDFQGQNAVIKTQLGLRLVPYFMTCVITPLFLGWTIEKVQKNPLRVTQMFALMSSLVFIFGPIVVTPDTPLFAAWSFCLFLLVTLIRGHEEDLFPGDRTRFSLNISILLGLSLAFAAYSKYSALLLAFLLVITGLGLWNSVVVGTISLVLIAPYILWNLSPELQSSQSGIFFQFKNATNPLTDPIRWSRIGDLWSSQLLLWGPIVFIGSIVFVFNSAKRLFSSQRRSTLSGTLFVWAFLPLLFFSITGLRRNPEANWPLVGAIGASALTLSRLYTHGFWLLTTTVLNVCFAILAGIILFNPTLLLPLVQEQKMPGLYKALSKDARFFEFQHWDSLRSSLYESTIDSNDPIAVETYQKLSGLLFMDDSAPEQEKLGSRLKIWEASRKSQFHLNSRYALPPDSKSYWLLLNENTQKPNHCRFYQQLFRGENPTEINSLYKCFLD